MFTENEDSLIQLMAMTPEMYHSYFKEYEYDDSNCLINIYTYGSDGLEKRTELVYGPDGYDHWEVYYNDNNQTTESGHGLVYPGHLYELMMTPGTESRGHFEPFLLILSRTIPCALV